MFAYLQIYNSIPVVMNQCRKEGGTGGLNLHRKQGGMPP